MNPSTTERAAAWQAALPTLEPPARPANRVRKFLVQFELAPDTRELQGGWEICAQLKPLANVIARQATLGPEPCVTVTEEL